MERRSSTRARDRLAAEIVHAGERLQAFLIDVSPTGAFLQMTRPIDVGQEIELRFVDDQLAPQVATARVTRRRAVPAAAASVMRPGIGVQWLEAPQFLRSLGSCGIEVEIERDPAEVAPDSRAPSGAIGPNPPAHEVGAPDVAPSESLPLDSSPGEIVPVGERPLLEQTIELGPAAVRAEIVVIDEGELGAFEELARSLGARTFRMRWGAQADPVVWEAPPRIVVVSARVAMSVPLGDAVLGAGAIGVAVCDSEASTLRARLRRQGYELVVQRATHPATLRLLLASLLFQRRERRKDRRRAFGAQARFWRRFRRAHGTLVELSSSGGRLLLAIDLPLRTRLRVRIPGRHAGGRTLALPATVLRSTPSGNGALVGLRFEKLSQRTRARLAALIRKLDAGGPVPLTAEQGTALSAGAERGERRRGGRARVTHQALSLDAARGVARDVLFGTDLSLGGMRVEPHPRLLRGDELQLALQPPGGVAPIQLRAEVARDDGERGLVLRFLAPTAATLRALERILDAASEIERTRSSRASPEERVVLGTLVEAARASG